MTERWLPVWRRSAQVDFVAPDEHPGLSQTILLGGQHVLAMMGATVLGPMLMGFDPNVSVLCSGVGTLLFFVLTGGRVPSYLGASFSFISLVIGLTHYSGHGINPDLAEACGGIIVAGAIYAFIGLVVQFTGSGWIEKLMPPSVTGAVGAAIGLNLAPAATHDLGTGGPGTACGLFGLLVLAVCSVYAPPLLRRISVLIALALGTLLYAVLANGLGLMPGINLETIRQAPLFGMPHFTAPHFTGHAAALIAPVALVLVAENLGHLKALGAMTGRSFDGLAGRAFMGDGLATMLSAAVGGTAVTTYVENIGVMALSRVYSTLVFVVAALFAIGLGFSPFFGAVVRALPDPVLSGVALGLFAMIAATMVRVWMDHRVDFTKPATLFPVGVALIAGAGDLTINIGGVALGGITTATLSAIILNQLLARGSDLKEPPLAP